jgi:hypothetical protein
MASIALLVASATTALADANPNNEGNHYGQIANPGHHYGQLKHHPTPPPSANPQSAPQPTPHTNPTPPAVHPATGTTTTAANSANPVVAAKPQGDVAPATFPSIILINAAPSPNALWWLVLAILPVLAIIWLIAATRIVVRIGQAVSKRTWRTAPAV